MLMAVWRLIVVFVATLVVANTTGLLPEADDIECADEAEGKGCPPTCATCTCVWHGLKTALAPIFEARTIELTSRTLELPSPRVGLGQLDPAPWTRPPIA